MNMTNLSASRAPEEEEDGAVILACCVASLVFTLVAVFGSGAWPFVRAWVLGVLA